MTDFEISEKTKEQPPSLVPHPFDVLGEMRQSRLNRLEHGGVEPEAASAASAYYAFNAFQSRTGGRQGLDMLALRVMEICAGRQQQSGSVVQGVSMGVAQTYESVSVNQPLEQSVASENSPEWNPPEERQSFDSNRITEMSERFELRNLRHRTGEHGGPDALVYIPRGFDPSKPLNVVVYNHGLYGTVETAFKNSDLQQQLDQAPPNTVLIVPEWQQHAGGRSEAMGPLAGQGFFRDMMQEILEKTPSLAGRTLADIGGISIISHSSGNSAAMKEIYHNGLEDKIVSVTMLDSLFNESAMDKWIQDNLYDLATGRKHYHNFCNRSVSAGRAQARRIASMLDQAGLSRNCMVTDFHNGRDVMDEEMIASHGIVVKYSTVDVRGRGAHNSVTNVYVGRTLKSNPAA